MPPPARDLASVGLTRRPAPRAARVVARAAAWAAALVVAPSPASAQGTPAIQGSPAAPAPGQSAPAEQGAPATAGQGAPAASAPAGKSAPVAPRSIAHGYSPYERETIASALRALGARLDAAPEGKTIEAIDVVPLEVIEDRDPAPGFLNQLHTTSKRHVIEREVLLPLGAPYQGVLADETARNLRRSPQLSLVIVTAIQGSSRDRVRLLVITKDVWSLRMAFDAGFGPGGLERLLVEPTESNVAGSQQTVLARFSYLPESYTLGASYRVPRLEGRWLAFTADANVIVNRRRGSAEGSYGSASIARPLYSTQTEWSWGASVSWRDEVIRRYVNAKLAGFDAKVTPQVDRIPYEYRGQRYTNTYAITRSFGWADKHDFTVGAEVNRRAYRTDDLSRFDPAAAGEFVATSVPVGDTRAAPFVQYHAYSNDFVRVLDFETLALQEDYRLGHDVWLRAYPVTKALGSSRNFIGAYAAAQYTVRMGDGVARAFVETTTEAEADRLSDASALVGLRIVTPRIGLGRIVFDASALNRYRNYLNRISYLGGDTRLRGYPSSFFAGKDVVVYNLEYRSRPIQILAVQLGLAAFYDVGDAFTGFDHLRPQQSVGTGFRVLFPQVDRIVFRGDLGFPMTRPLPAGVSAVSFFFAFEQAFPVPGVGTVAASGLPSTTGAIGQ